MPLSSDLAQFLRSVHPYDSLNDSDLDDLSKRCDAADFSAGSDIFKLGDTVDSLYIVVTGEIEITDEADVQLSLLGPRNSFGERALLREDVASRTATAIDVSVRHGPWLRWSAIPTPENPRFSTG